MQLQLFVCLESFHTRQAFCIYNLHSIPVASMDSNVTPLVLQKYSFVTKFCSLKHRKLHFDW